MSREANDDVFELLDIIGKRGAGVSNGLRRHARNNARVGNAVDTLIRVNATTLRDACGFDCAQAAHVIEIDAFEPRSELGDR